MGLPVISVAAGGLPVVEATFGTPVTEAANGRGVPVTKVVGKPGLPVVFETIGVGGGALAPPLDAVANVTGAWSLSRNMLTSFGAGTRYTKSGTAIITLEDQSGNNRDFTDQSNPGQRPVETTAFPANILCADFNGSTQLLLGAATSALLTATSGAMVISVIIDTVTLNNAQPYLNHPIIEDNGSNGLGITAGNLNGVTFTGSQWAGSRQHTPGLTGSTGTAYVLMWRHHGGNLYLSINGGSEVSVASGNSDLSQSILMGWNATRLCDMKVAEMFATNNGGQTAALAAAVSNMMTYAGIGSAPSYTGPGDKVSGATGWWGLRAYNAAYATGSNPAIDINDQAANAHPLTVNIKTDGTLDVAAINAWVTANSVTQIKITKLYNQAGGSIGHLTPFSGTTVVLKLSATDLAAGRPTIDFVSGGACFLESAGSITLNQPFSLSIVISADSASRYWGDASSSTVYALYRTSSFAIAGGGGELVGNAATLVDFHAVQSVLSNNGSAAIYIDGGDATGSGVGTSGLAGQMRLGADSGGVFSGRISEFGIWGGTIFTTQNKSDLNTNQQAYWGF